jgi:hypothetical protein
MVPRAVAVEELSFRVIASTGPLDVIGEAKCQGNDRQGRTCGAGRRKYGASGDIQIRDIMNSAIAVDDTPMWIITHSGGAHVM